MSAIISLIMPRWGIDMAEGRLVRWLIAEGEPVGPGTPVLEVESEKTIAPVEANDRGTLRRQVAREGDSLPVGSLLGVIATNDIGDEAIDAFIATRQQRPQEAEAPRAHQGTVEVQGHSIRYVELGSGLETVAFVHGFGGSLESWAPVQGLLAREFRTLSLDLPGHGSSTKTPTSVETGFFVEIIAGFLSAMRATPAHLVGHSWGGQLAMALAARHPEAVASLTLIGSAGHVSPEARAFMTDFVGASRRAEVKNILLRLFHDPRFVTRDMVELVLKYRRLDGAEAALRGIATAVAQTEEVAARRSPHAIRTQIIRGEADKIVPIDSALAAGEGATVHRLANVGHMPQIEASARVAELIGRFAAGSRE